MKKKKHRSDEELLSPAELTMLHAELQNSREDRSKLPPHDTSDRANAIRFAKRNPLFIASMTVIALLVVATLVFGGIMLAKYLASRPNTSDYTVYLGKDSYEVPYEEAVRDGTIYVDMKKIAEFAGMIVSGSETRMKFTASDEHYLRFENESEYAVINGCRVEMPIPAVVKKDVCLVPFSFLQKAVSQGLRLKLDTDHNVIKVTQQVYQDTKEPAALLFVTDGFTVLQSLHTSKQEEIPASAYPIDISPYLAYINPKDADEYLVLVNKQNPLGMTYAPTDLLALMGDEIDLPAKNNSLKLRHDAAYALKAMMLAMEAENPTLVEELLVTSAYRDYAYQQKLYDGYVNDYLNAGMSEEEARAEASRTSARAGESEHQTGLCFDFITLSMAGILDERFENTLAFDWLKTHAHLYGFVLRYPKDKVAVTEYDYEPWHYRFVGRDTAIEIYNAGLCLEEYLELN